MAAAAVLALTGLGACGPGSPAPVARSVVAAPVVAPAPAPVRATAVMAPKASRSAPAAVRAAAVPDALVPDLLVPGDAPVIRAAPVVAPAVVGPVVSVPGPSVKEIWAQARARHRAPRAYLTTERRDVDCLHLKCIALTFDDGPGAGTEKLLDVLARTGVRATFFVLGRNVKATPAPVIRAAWDGHEIGVHTWDHRSLMGRGTSDMAADILRTSDEITRVAGVRPTLVRPPYGDLDAATAKRVRMPLIMWSVDTIDWRDHDPAVITQRIVDRAAPGSIVLMHDVYSETEQAVPGIIEHYKGQGYTFVTVSEMYGGRLKPGRMYHGREVVAAKARAKDRARGLPEPMPVDDNGTPIDAAAPFPPAPSAVPPPDAAAEPAVPAPGDVTEPDPPAATDPALDPAAGDPTAPSPSGPPPTESDPAPPEPPPATLPEPPPAEAAATPPPAPRGR